MITASSVINNQILEKDLDKKMDRTKKRPLPTNRISYKNSLIISVLFMLSGLLFMFLYFNVTAAILGLMSLLLYTFAYTPLKRVGPIAVFIGAIPGALPPLIGWVAFTGNISIEAIIIFSIQFIWQFPHFWAIGWLMHEDYKKAGFKLLPSGKKDQVTSFQIVFYTIWMILFSLIPASSYSGSLFLSLPGAIIISLLGIVMLYFSISLMKLKTDKAAKNLILSSIAYISLLQVVFVIDRYL